MEAKQVKDLMEAYASVYTQSEEVIAESDCECEDEKSEKETPEMNGKKKVKKEEEKEDEMKEGYISEDPVQDYRDMKRAKENAAGMRGSELSHSTKPSGGSAKQKPQKPQPRSREFSHGGSSQPRSREFAREEVETDLFDYLLEYLVAEGYADTNKAALAIMANMSEEWRQNIVETIAGGGYTPNPVGNAIRAGTGLLKKAMSNPSVQGAIKTGTQSLQKSVPSGGYSTRPGDGKPYADGPLWDGPKKPTPQPQRKPQQAPMRDEPLW
jgi:hypothetical protein